MESAFLRHRHLFCAAAPFMASSRALCQMTESEECVLELRRTVRTADESGQYFFKIIFSKSYYIAKNGSVKTIWFVIQNFNTGFFLIETQSLYGE